MKNKDLIISYPDFFVSELHEDSIWLKFSGNFFHNFISFDYQDFLHDIFTMISNEPDIKSVVINSAFHESGSDEYMRFFLLECQERDLGHFGFSDTMDRYDLHRFCNVIDQTIMDIKALKKPVVHVCTGDVLALFMNISLACDYRIITDDTVFHNVYQEIGMLPKGGAAYFLNRLVGPGRAAELLLHKQRITAEDAVKNSIADCVVSKENLESETMKVVRKFSQVPDQTLYGVKRLVNYPLKELEEYLEYETEQILKIGNREDFNDQ